MKNIASDYLLFQLDSQNYAFPLNSVFTVIPSQSITELESSIDFFCGIIDYHGEILPVINLRKKFRLNDSEMKISDRFIIAETDNGKIGFIVDAVDEIISVIPEEITESTTIFNGLSYVRLVNLETGIVMLHDPEKILTEPDYIEMKRVLDAHN